MISRRNFLIASGGTLAALSLPRAANAFAAPSHDILTITSHSHVLPRDEQGDRHITLSGDRLKDIATLEKAFGQVNEKQITLHIDAADLVLLDIALTRVSTPYVSVAAVNGQHSFRRSSTLGA